MTLEMVFAALVDKGRAELTGDAVLAKTLELHGVEVVGGEARLPKEVQLLEGEGIAFANNSIDLNIYRWDPEETDE